MRMLVVFEKRELLRHVGHLDLMRTLQRVLRRTGLPVAYSQGFNPHMVMNFAAPLSVGAAGCREIMDVALSESVPEDVFLQKINQALPPDMRAVMARGVDDAYPAPMSRLFAAAYEIRVESPDGRALTKAIPGYLQQSEIPAMRKTKSGEKPCDLRPMIYELKSSGEDGGPTILSAILALREDATCKPDLLMTSLSAYSGINIPSYFVTRIALLGKVQSGALSPLEDL